MRPHMLHCSTALSRSAAEAGSTWQVHFAGLMQYDGEEKLPKHFLVPPPDIERTTGEYLARGCGVPTYACSESQKIGAQWLWSAQAHAWQAMYRLPMCM